MRPTRAEVDLDAIRHNVRTLAARSTPAALMAVVKADGYGHGAVPVAEAAVDAGARWLGVATVEEAAVLRHSGRREPILVLSEPHPSSVEQLVELDLAVAVYSQPAIETLALAAARAGRTIPVHLKVDTGMHRVGARPEQALELARAISATPGLDLAALWTHCAVADEPERPDTDHQLDLFEKVLGELEEAGLRPPLVHAANSAAAIAHPRSRYDLVRCGIAMYGIAPAPAMEGIVDLRPAMRLVSEVSFVKDVSAGTRVSYGLTYETPVPCRLATVPIGYADGVPRRLSSTGGEVLIRGRRRPVAGVVTMDQLVADCGADADVEVGDEVVLIGRQGTEEVTANEWGTRLGTIGYEIVCGVGARIPRVYRPASACG